MGVTLGVATLPLASHAMSCSTKYALYCDAYAASNASLHLNGKSLAFPPLLFLAICERNSETVSLVKTPNCLTILRRLGASLSSPLSRDSKTLCGSCAVMTNRELNTLMHRQLNRGLNTDERHVLHARELAATRARTRHVLLPTANTDTRPQGAEE